MNDKFSNTEPSKIGEMPDRAQNDIVTSLAEKAMSIASPVVPTKGDGQVDHERLESQRLSILCVVLFYRIKHLEILAL